MYLGETAQREVEGFRTCADHPNKDREDPVHEDLVSGPVALVRAQVQSDCEPRANLNTTWLARFKAIFRFFQKKKKKTLSGDGLLQKFSWVKVLLS
eukprot:m.30887 g.30887  ORF g.30887 m.30887 type:complete len:96 (+) comp16355_c1_seq1:1031-1318(+)